MIPLASSRLDASQFRPPFFTPEAQDEGQPVQVGTASNERPVGGRSSHSGQFEEFVTVAGAGEGGPAPVAHASAPDAPRRIAAAAAGLAFLLPLCACGADPDGARETAEAYGFTNIIVRGYAPLRCGELDLHATAFTGYDLTGSCRRAVVCSSPLGASHVRDVRPSDACSDIIRRPAHMGVIR